MRRFAQRPLRYTGGLIAVTVVTAFTGRALAGPPGGAPPVPATQGAPQPLPGVVRTLDGQQPAMGTHALWFYIRGKYRTVPP
ncbi:MAG: hypothetical protein ABR498_04195 [Candidatus Dormibacteria bacterium]